MGLAINGQYYYFFGGIDGNAVPELWLLLLEGQAPNGSGGEALRENRLAESH